MKKLFIKYRTILLALLVCLQTCEEETHQPIGSDKGKPRGITHATVENLPGGARIRYDVPNDKSLLYVKALYEIRPGVGQEAKSSFYTNSVEVNGFGRAGTYSVTLIAVGRNGEESQPFEVDVEPTTPPVEQAFATLDIQENWGGATVYMENQYEAELTVEVVTPDSFGNLAIAETFYTKMKNARMPIRGFDPEPRTFGVVLKDHWGNRSDTVFKEVTPWFEELIPKPFAKVDLPTDYSAAHNNGTAVLERIWDDSQSENDFVTVPGHGLPQWFTFDLKATVQLSRLVLFKRLSANFLYNSGAVKRWEIYGSNNPNPDGSFDDSWVLLGECESIKPSGLPAGENTEEDRAYAAAGEEFLFPEDVPPVRYLRWKTLENWGNVSHVNITEIDVYGQIQ
jgi:Sad1 / UNC-like C-terminal.